MQDMISRHRDFAKMRRSEKMSACISRPRSHIANASGRVPDQNKFEMKGERAQAQSYAWRGDGS